MGVRLAVLGVTGITLLLMRMSLMGSQPPEFAPSDNPAANTDQFLTRILTFLFLPVVNFWLLMCPRVLSFDWSMDTIPLIESIWDPRNLVSLLFYGVLAFTGIQLLKRVVSDGSSMSDVSDLHLNGNAEASVHRGKVFDDNRNRKGNQLHKRNQKSPDRTHNSSEKTNMMKEFEGSVRTISTRSDKAALVAMATTIVSFIPATNLFFYVGFVIAERILYIPSVGFCLLAGIGVDRLYSQAPSNLTRKLTCLCMCVLVIVFSVKTVMRNEDWHDEESLYRSGIDVIPAKGE